MASVLGLLLPFVPLLLVALTLAITWLVARLVRLILVRLMPESLPPVRAGASRLASVIVWLVGGIIAVQQLGVSADILLLIVGLFGAAAVVGLREPLANFGAKYFSDIYTPIKVGDLVRLREHSGKVVEINPMSTVLLTEDDQLVSIPNAFFMREVVVNASPQAWKKLVLPVSIPSDADLPAFESALLKSLGKLRLRFDRRFPPVLTTRARNSQSVDLSLTLMIRLPEERDAILVEVNKRIAEAMQLAQGGGR
jgi:small-conductance mechanosensitive channel